MFSPPGADFVNLDTAVLDGTCNEISYIEDATEDVIPRLIGDIVAMDGETIVGSNVDLHREKALSPAVIVSNNQ